MKSELHPSKNSSKDGLRHHAPTFLLMDGSATAVLCFLVRGQSALQTAMGIAMATASLECLADFHTLLLIRDATILLARR